MYAPKNETDFADAYARGERDFDLRGYAHPLPAGLRRGKNNLRPTDD